MSSTPKASSLETLRGLDVAPRSVTSASGAELGIARTDDGERLVAMAPKGSLFFGDLEGEPQGHHDGRTFLLGPLSTHNAAACGGRCRGSVPGCWACKRPRALATGWVWRPRDTYEP